MNTIEVWKAIPGYEGIYEVSDQGNVRSLDRYVYRPTLLWGQAAMTFCEGRELKPQRDKKGYLEICLSNGCKKTAKRFKVHRLVAMAFIPNPDSLPMVNHKDEDKHNNRVDNLEWVTPQQNCLHGTATARQNKSRHHNDPDNKRWKEIAMKHALGCCRYNKADNTLVKQYASLTEAAQDSGTNITTILNQCKGKTQSRTSTYWRYAEN